MTRYAPVCYVPSRYETLGERMNQSAAWPTSAWCFVTGLACLVIGLGAGVYILVKKGKRRRMTPEELNMRVLGHDIHETPNYSVVGPAVGVWVEAEATADTLRELAAQRDWKVFWCWPICMVSWMLGFQLFATGIAIEMEHPIVAIISGIFLVPGVIVWAYRPFGVLYANDRTPEDEPLNNESAEDMARRW